MENEPNYQFKLRTSPGLISWAREEEGHYSYDHGVLGGIRWGRHSSKEVADYIFRHSQLTRVNELCLLGWDDVIAELDKLQIAGDVIKLNELRQQAIDLRLYIDEHKNWDYWLFRRHIYDDLKRSCGDSFDEADVSVRRMHYAALHALAAPDRLKEIERQMLNLEKSLKNKF